MYIKLLIVLILLLNIQLGASIDSLDVKLESLALLCGYLS